MLNTTMVNVSNATEPLLRPVEPSTSLLWSVPRLFKSLSSAAEQQARETHDTNMDSALASFNYFISPYAGACMFMAIILNRTVVFASSRRQSDRLARSPKVVLRAVSLLVLASTLWDVLLEFSFIYPSIRGMLGQYSPETRQSLESLLWEVFITLCVSQFLETFVSITSAQEPTNDTGLTLFEHSLAFQECQFMTEPTPQLLMICTYSLITQTVTHILGLVNWKKYQLIPSTVLGLGFLGFYCYSAATGTLMFFPNIVIVSMIPQLLVIIIITLCLVIYGLAVLVTRDSSNLTYTPMIRNLKDSLNLQMHDDFNSLLMRFGFIMFNAVDNEEYVNEVSELNFRKGTYQDSHHLVSAYFNKLENNPELISMKKSRNEGDEGISSNWFFFRKVMNIAKLIQSVVKIILAIKRRNNRKDAATSTRKNKLTSRTPITPLLQLGSDLDELEDSEDYTPDSDSDLEPFEYESDIDEDQPEVEYISTLAMARSSNAPTRNGALSNTTTLPKPRPIDELFTPTDVLHLISPTDLTEASYINSIRTHLHEDRRLTRSSYCEINEDSLLREVILSKRPHLAKQENDEDMNCVVCQTDRRCIVLWPCKCFALCEGCRLSLGVRGFAICVCCRGKVEGYSKVFMP